MDLKAFNKLYAEAEEALAERRLLDALSLTEALQNDLPDPSASTRLQELRSRYAAFLHETVVQGGQEDGSSDVHPLFAETIDLLQQARGAWKEVHAAQSPFARRTSASEDPAAALTDLLATTRRSRLGKEAYHAALDAAFSLLCAERLTETDVRHMAALIPKLDGFVRVTLTGGLLLGLMDNFQPAKVHLLLAFGKEAQTDMDRAVLLDSDEEARSQTEMQAADLQARVAVALALVYKRYLAFFALLPQLTAEVRAFMESDSMRPQLPQLLRAMAVESLTERVGQRVNDILPSIKDLFEKHQPHLSGTGDEARQEEDGEDDNGQEDPTEPKFEVRVAHIHVGNDSKLFRQMANFAKQMDMMRQQDMDIHYGNFVHMKRSKFFAHPAHWFYPFHIAVPEVQDGLRTESGKLDRLNLSIIEGSRFCDSDCYSYAGMLAFMRNRGQRSVSDMIRDQLDDLPDMDDEETDDALADLSEGQSDSAAEGRLNPFASFCQNCYRFFNHPDNRPELGKVFVPTAEVLLPLLPLFDGLFTDLDQLMPTAGTFVHMGANELAVLLLDHAMERFGSTAQSLALRGYALMQQQLWRRAIGDFQQSQILEDEEGIRLHMARCYEALGDWQDALPLLAEESAAVQDSDPELVEEMARCLVMLRQWDDAVQQFFRLEFMNKRLHVAWRGIGWCSMHQGKFERAEHYYRQLIDDSRRPSWADLLNLGHALWLQRRPGDALLVYRQFAAAFNRTRKAGRAHFRHWSEAWREDAHSLLEMHYGAEQVALMLDAIALKDV